MRIRDLGPLEVEVDGIAIPVVGLRLSSLLALLAYRVNEVVSTVALTEAVWPLAPMERAAASLESLVWRLRKILEPDRKARQAAAVLCTEEGGYRLALSSADVDSHRFVDQLQVVRQMVADGRSGAAAESAAAADALWRGEPFGAVPPAEWMVVAREGLTGARTDLAELRVQALLETDQPERAVSLLEPLLLDQPFRERFWKQRMLGLYRVGRQAAALDAFRQVRTLLADELGVDPGLELQELHRRILQHDRDLDRRSLTSETMRGTVEVHLPVRANELIGRAEDLASLATLLAHTPVVTLTGPGGVGKTRLGVEVAHSVRESYGDGVYFVDLTAVHDPESLPLLVAQLLSLKVEVDATVSDTIVNWAAHRHLLLVLDNCEHVVAVAARLVGRLAAECRSVRVLATSREPLEVAGEHRWMVPPLTLPGVDVAEVAASSAVALLVDRLRGMRPDLDLHGVDGETLGRICTAVAGLPLGIELAAGHARSFELAEIADALASSPVQLARLGGGPQRQATLHDTVDWSYRLLTMNEQALHRRLSCISGGVTLEAAAALCAVAPLVPTEAMTLLSGLTHRSLLVATHPGGPGRPTGFVQLVPVRAHADLALADPLERAAVELARNDWVFEHVSNAPYDGRPGQDRFYDWLDDNQASVRATLESMLIRQPDRRGVELTVLLSQYWFDRNRLIEGGRWARAAAALDRSRDLDALDSAIAQTVLGCMLALGSDPGTAREIFADTIGLLANAVPRHVDVLGQLLILVSLSAFLGLHWDVGWQAADAAVDLAAAAGKRHLLLRARALRAACAVWCQGLDVATAEADAVLSELERFPNAHAELNAAVARSAAARWQRDGVAGVYWTGRAVQANRSVGAVNMADLGELLAAHLLNAGRPEDAVRCFAASAAVHARSGLAASRRVATAPSVAALRALVPAEVFERVWAGGERLGRAEPEHFIDEWLVPAGDDLSPSPMLDARYEQQTRITADLLNRRPIASTRSGPQSPAATAN